jgi:hypothetical protein
MYEHPPMPTRPTILANLPGLPRDTYTARGAEDTVGRARLSHVWDKSGGAVRVQVINSYCDRHKWRGRGLEAAGDTLECENCGYSRLDVHRTGTSMITYCQQCGQDTEVKRDNDIERGRWTDEERELHRKDLHVIQGGKKKKKARR